VFFRPEKEHRAALIVRGENLSDALTDTDPQKTGLHPLQVKPANNSEEARRSADIMNQVIEQAKEILKNDHPANMILARGFAKYPKIEVMEDIYKLKCAAIAVYPMYRGLAKLVGMDVLPAPKDVQGEFDLLKQVYNDYDFFFVHIKGTDSAGEDGDYDRKKKVIEDFDKLVPQLLELNPDVLIFTGDHSTPTQMAAHSWHPVPTMIRAKYGRRDECQKYGERELQKGLLGIIPAMEIMPLAMAKALKFEKFGA
jgi:2,3-bisphosphoglycerate-independent phosphoglycerate mutase